MSNDQDVRLSPHFWLSEAWESETADRLGYDNRPPVQLITTLKRSAENLEQVRTLLGFPISVSSWYRCLKLNRALKSKDTSQHLLGEAQDFRARNFGTPVQIVQKIMNSAIPFDQLILEHTWVHISWAISTGKPRRQVLTLLLTSSGKTKGYAPGITDSKGRPWKDTAL